MIRDIYNIICIETGEVIKVNGNDFYNLYENDLLNMDWSKEIWFFHEKDLEKIKIYIR